jgi:hypothetical protein
VSAATPWAALGLEGGVSTPVGVPKGEDLNATGFCVDLVVEVVASPAQKEAADTLSLGVACSRSDSRLGGHQFEGSLKVLNEGKRSGLPVGSPPRRRSPDLHRGTRHQPDGEARKHELLAEFPEEGLRIDELTLRGLIERLFEGSFLFGG